jgi:hypothetical protein
VLSARVKFLGIGRNIVEKVDGSGGIRTHASEETGALNQRLRPLGHATLIQVSIPTFDIGLIVNLDEQTHFEPFLCLRPYHVERTSSRPITEVKQH